MSLVALFYQNYKLIISSLFSRTFLVAMGKYFQAARVSSPAPFVHPAITSDQHSSTHRTLLQVNYPDALIRTIHINDKAYNCL